MEKPRIKESWLTRRCVVLADGFYVWEVQGKRKFPHLFQLKKNQLFGFAAIWQPGISGEPPGCAVVTTEANELMLPLHSRMPVVLPSTELIQEWLCPQLNPNRQWTKPLDSDRLKRTRVTPKVNQFRYDQPDCYQPESGDIQMCF